MIELLPVVYRPLFFNPPAGEDPIYPIDIIPDWRLVWQLHADGLGWGFYQCQTGVIATGDYDRNRTPYFPLVEHGKRIECIPEHIEDWMRRYTEVFQIGAQWARSVKLK